MVKQQFGQLAYHNLMQNLIFTQQMQLATHHIYGNNRLGIKHTDTTLYMRNITINGFDTLGNVLVNEVLDAVQLQIDTAHYQHALATKQYELTNHLGNVLATVLDRKTQNQADVVSAQHYYPFGSTMQTWEADGKEYAFGFNGMEKVNDTYGEGKAYDFGARIYDSRLGRWLSLDPLQKKYPFLSAYCFTNNDPILFVDVDGKDWFVNNNTGQVIYVRDASQVSQQLIANTGIGGKASDYERLGPNDMFGKKVNIAGSNLLEQKFVFVEASKFFMEDKGYSQAEKVNILETQTVTTVGDDQTTSFGFKEMEKPKITYVKPEKLNTKENVRQERDGDEEGNVMTTSITYKLIKPVGQDSRETAMFSQNKPNDSFYGLVKQFVSIILDLYQAKQSSAGRAPSQPSPQKAAGK